MKKVTKIRWIRVKRIISLTLIIFVTIGLISCTETNKDDIPVLKWILPGNTQVDIDSVMSEVNKILIEKLGCTLEIQFLDSRVYTERMTMLMASKDPFDLCFTGYVNPYSIASRSGGLLALDDYLKDCPELVNSIPDYAMTAAKIDNKIYAIPNMQIMANCTGLFLLKDLVDEYGKLELNKIKKLPDIEPFLEWVKTNHPEKVPFQPVHAFGIRDYDYDFTSEICRGVEVIEKDGRIIVCKETETEHRIDEANLMREFYEKGYIRKDIALVNDETKENEKNMYAAWRGVYKPGAGTEMSDSRKEDIICVQLTEPVILYNNGRTTMTAIGRYSKHPLKAIKLIELINTDKELFNLISFGIEGKHYKKLDEKHISIIDDAGYNPHSAWKFGNQFNAYLYPEHDENVWELTQEMNNNAKVSALLGFEFDRKPVSAEVALIESIFNKYKSLYKGYLPLESYYNELNDELDAAGIDVVISETEKQIDEFIKNKNN